MTLVWIFLGFIATAAALIYLVRILLRHDRKIDTIP